MKRKNKGVIKRSKIITQQLEAIENPNIADIKSVIIKYPKTSCKLFNTIRQPAKVSHVGSDKSFNGTLYSETKKESFLNSKITKQSHVFKVYASYYHVYILNSFNLELQLKDIESAIKNKQIDLLSEFKGFKFVEALVLELKKVTKR